MRICFVTPDYPDKNRQVFTFVDQLVQEFASQGMKCTVIAPYSITHNRKLVANKEYSDNLFGNKIEILRPYYLSFSNLKLFGFNFSAYFHKNAVNKALKKMHEKPSVIYSHFWISGMESFDFAKNNNIPLFIATGESVIPDFRVNKKLKDFIDYVSGVICVSSKNKDESISKGLTTENKCIVLPNAIDNSIFKQLSKIECRRKLGFKNEDFIAAFVGWFNDRKGSKRLSSALSQLNDKDIKAIFIGAGNKEPDYKNTIFKGLVEHSQIVEYLNCADIFVLPTLNEGCCNAIIEAMACGLPIISSDLSFNYDVLNETNSILTNPLDTIALAEAIKELKENESKRRQLSIGALVKAEELTLKSRVNKIRSFIEIKINDKKFTSH